MKTIVGLITILINVMVFDASAIASDSKTAPITAEPKMKSTNGFDNIEGVYVADYVNPKVTDTADRNCMVIRKSKKGFELYLSSIQSGGYSCYAEGELSMVGDKLFWQDWYVGENNENHEGLYISRTDKKIMVNVVSSGSRISMQYCGIHAALYDMTFDFDKKTTPWNEIGHLDEIGRYCPSGYR